MAKQQRIFISYRRQGGIDTARWLRDHLAARGYSVFMDLENLRSGNFNYALYNEIRNCDVFLIVLSNGSLDRCVYPDDWVRHELAFAIQCGIKIIPIIKDDFWFPEYLPEDVDPIRYYNGLRVSYDFFDAFMNKLEEYITGKPVVRRKSPVLPIVCVCAALLVGGFFLGRMLLDRDEGKPDDNPPGQSSLQNKDTKPKETTAPPTTNPPETTVPPTTNPPETTVPPTTEPEETIPPTVPYDPTMVGNSVTNLCNEPFLATLDETRTVHLSILDRRWYNLILSTDLTYTYDKASRSIIVRWNKDSTKQGILQKNVDCQYLFVTSEWVYYALKEGSVERLYRAANDMENGRINQHQPIVENVLSQNRIAIVGDYVYCWIQAEGLCRFQTDGSGKKLLLSSDGFSAPTTFQVADGNVYFFEPASGIYSVSVNGGPVRQLLDTRNSGAVITHAVEEDGFIHYIMKSENAAAEAWCVDTDGRIDFKRASLPETDMEPLTLNISLSELYLRVTHGEKTHLYVLKENRSAFEFSRTYD